MEQDAEAGALADFESVLGKRLKVSWIYAYWNEAEDGEFTAPPGRYFVVEVKSTQRGDILHWNDDKFLDPYWTVEVIDDLDLLPPGARSAWIYGRTWSVSTVQQASNG
ncbi:MAG: hypothetical protein F8N36_13880 [Desulfovibrio sp.]|uniref:hypothetical protein n=1 Tax=Desulfovibrio sp. TaxID=885 RepID=UPI00135EA078|nr:hypothetical protein [Desulfovibrio sp.]MTJ93928.1 hypothetical protein [Desulfovibrio sp.]